MKFDNIKSKFPIFKQKIKGKPLIYLDSANSSQKPKAVIDEMSRFYETEFSNVGRSVHTLAELGVAKKLLIKGFLNEIFDNIPEEKIRTFLQKSLAVQIDEVR